MEERRKNHECTKEELLGRIIEFMNSAKATQAVLISMGATMVLQIVTFAFLWGQLTTTVAKNTEYLWKEVAPKTMENTKNIDKILAKFELITVIQGSTGTTGPQGICGIQGEKGNDGRTAK
jgi:hypothetical protein